MTRRDYGTGTIVQRADGAWQGRIDLGRGPDGRRRRPAFTGQTRREVQKAIASAIAQRDAGFGANAPERTTTGAFLDQWIGGSAPNRLRPRTMVGYRSILDRHLRPALGHVPLRRLSGAQVQELVNELASRGASPATTRNVHAVLRRALGTAVRWGLLARNPALGVDLPPMTTHDVRALGIDDARAILDAVQGDRIEPLVTVALLTGIRQGESIGLQWDDVNLD